MVGFKHTRHHYQQEMFKQHIRTILFVTCQEIASEKDNS